MLKNLILSIIIVMFGSYFMTLLLSGLLGAENLKALGLMDNTKRALPLYYISLIITFIMVILNLITNKHNKR